MKTNFPAEETLRGSLPENDFDPQAELPEKSEQLLVVPEQPTILFGVFLVFFDRISIGDSKYVFCFWEKKDIFV